MSAPEQKHIPLRVKPTDPSDPKSIVQAFFKSYQSEYQLHDPDSELKIIAMAKDKGPYEKIGMTHVRMRQQFKGLPIFGAQIILHLTKDKRVSSASGRITKTPDIRVAPAIKASEARKIALDNIPDKIKSERRNASLPIREPVLGIFVETFFTGKDAPPVLAYQVKEFGYICYINATNGTLLFQYDDIKTARDRRTYTEKSPGTLPGTLVLSESESCAIAGYDLRSAADRSLTFDYDGDGDDDLFLYRPGRGAAWVARSNGNGTFTAVYAVGDNGPAAPNGIAGYDLLSTSDRVLAFDYDGDGDDDLFLYRPGRGAAWVARSNGNGTFTAVYAVGDNGPAAPNGIAGYDLLSTSDQVLVFDYNNDNKSDLFLYRPGRGAAWIASSNGDATFNPRYP